MAEERLQRRLAAILSADVVGYSRLMGMDEAGTLSRLNALRRDRSDDCRPFRPDRQAHGRRCPGGIRQRRGRVTRQGARPSPASASRRSAAATIAARASAPRAIVAPLQRQTTRLGAQRPLPGTPISPVCTIGLTAAVAPDLPAYCRWRPSEALSDLPDRPAHRNATGNLFAFLKP